MAVDVDLKNEIRVRREAEWLCRGLPFPQGVLTDVAALGLRNEVGEHVPLAAEELGCWPDGSVRWVLLQFPVSFAGNGQKTYSLDWAGDARRSICVRTTDRSELRIAPKPRR